MNILRKGWIYAVFLAFFSSLSAWLLFKHYHLLSVWPFDEAYQIQQFHNWRSQYPRVTLQPLGTAGKVGEKPFQEQHKKGIYAFYKIFYWLWPYPETLILLYAFFMSLSVLALYYFLIPFRLKPHENLCLILSWLFYPLQLKMAGYSYCDPLSWCGVPYFLYLSLLHKDSRFSFLGASALLLPREESLLLILPTLLFFPKKWKTLLLHFVGLTVLTWMLGTRKTTGLVLPLGEWRIFFSQFALKFYANFLSTQTILWVVVLVKPLASWMGLAIMAVMPLHRSPIYFLDYQFSGRGYGPVGSFHYYSLFLAPMMAAVVLGLAKTSQVRRGWYVYLTVALMMGPGLMYLFHQRLEMDQNQIGEIRKIHKFIRTQVDVNEPVVTNHALSALFANRDQVYVYFQPPHDIQFTPENMFSRSSIAVIHRVDFRRHEMGLFSPLRKSTWKLVLQTPNYLFYKRLKAHVE